jgi:hypothetical protein
LVLVAEDEERPSQELALGQVMVVEVAVENVGDLRVSQLDLKSNQALSMVSLLLAVEDPSQSCSARG